MDTTSTEQLQQRSAAGPMPRSSEKGFPRQPQGHQHPVEAPRWLLGATVMGLAGRKLWGTSGVKAASRTGRRLSHDPGA